ncbi:MAG: hypothetical protein ABL997_13220, partial [Planctomycetota bacterium]
SGRARLREWLEVNDAATAVELELVRLRGTAAIARARLHEAMGEALSTMDHAEGRETFRGDRTGQSAR